MAIVGGGVIGCAIAFALARATSLRIVVFERGRPGCEASNAAAGVLAVASAHARQGVLLDLRRRPRPRSYRTWCNTAMHKACRVNY
ncbi:MAG: hypothetical protein H6Q33_467 [Deltaproteobacteria bacterium]|nr:hypothetical protein [Deltaproteobacteria bacterium]